jgi:hypothetical protein
MPCDPVLHTTRRLGLPDARTLPTLSCVGAEPADVLAWRTRPLCGIIPVDMRKIALRQPSRSCGWRRHVILPTAGSVDCWPRTAPGIRLRITSRSSRASARPVGRLQPSF